MIYGADGSAVSSASSSLSETLFESTRAAMRRSLSETYAKSPILLHGPDGKLMWPGNISVCEKEFRLPFRMERGNG